MFKQGLKYRRQNNNTPTIVSSPKNNGGSSGNNVNNTSVSPINFKSNEKSFKNDRTPKEKQKSMVFCY